MNTKTYKRRIKYECMKCPDCNVILNPTDLHFKGDPLSVCPRCDDEFITLDE